MAFLAQTIWMITRHALMLNLAILALCNCAKVYCSRSRGVSDKDRMTRIVLARVRKLMQRAPRAVTPSNPMLRVLGLHQISGGRIYEARRGGPGISIHATRRQLAFCSLRICWSDT